MAAFEDEELSFLLSAAIDRDTGTPSDPNVKAMTAKQSSKRHLSADPMAIELCNSTAP